LPGGTIGIFSPSGAVDPEKLARGVSTLTSRGFRIKFGDAVTHQHLYFAGTDDERVADFHRLLADPSIDAMMMSRGGYGFSRIIHRIDWQAVATSRKTFVGFSDFTAFNLATLAQANLVTFAGPGCATDFDYIDTNPEVIDDHAFMEAHCWPALRGESMEVTVEAAHPYPAQTIVGTLWGSNSSLLTHLVGTPFLPDIDDGILFIEEIDEDPYAVERQFYQLYHAGILQRQRAVLLGDFTDCVQKGGRFPYAMSHVVETLRSMLGVPVLTGLPFGHVARKLTLPFGGRASVAVTADGYVLRY
jgi:muramoyltetrapeptide carboxypeptidase